MPETEAAALAWHFWTAYLPAIVLGTGFFVEFGSYLRPRRPPWTNRLSRRFLWGGTAAAVVASATGFLLSGFHRNLFGFSSPWVEHRFLSFWATGIFILLSVWRWRAKKRPGPIFAMVWAAGLWVLIKTTMAGMRFEGSLGI